MNSLAESWCRVLLMLPHSECVKIALQAWRFDDKGK